MFWKRFENMKGIIRSRNSKDRQHNGKKKRDKITNNDTKTNSEKQNYYLLYCFSCWILVFQRAVFYLWWEQGMIFLISFTAYILDETQDKNFRTFIENYIDSENKSNLFWTDAPLRMTHTLFRTENQSIVYIYLQSAFIIFIYWCLIR